MKKLVLLYFLALLMPVLSQAQANIFSAGMCHTAGIPAFNPGARGCRLALDTTDQSFYLWKVGTTWVELGRGVDELTGCSAPSYTPNKWQSSVVINKCATPEIYYYYSGSWHQKGGGSGGSGTVNTNATLTGDGSGGSPLGIAQQSAATSEVLTWTGATWEPSWGNPYTFVTTGATITTAVNEILIGTVAANVVMGLPTCDATNDQKRFKFVRNGTDGFSVTIDPGGSQQFYGGLNTITQWGKVSIDCTCRFSAGTGVWFYDNN